MSRTWPARIAALCAVVAVTTVIVLWWDRSMRDKHANSGEADSLIATTSDFGIMPPDTDTPALPNIELPSNEPPDFEFLGKGPREFYATPPSPYSGCDFELSEGRFLSDSFSDVIDHPLGYAPRPARGTYRTDGNHIVFNFYKSAHVIIVEKREIDGVTVLLSPTAIENDRRGGHPTTDTYGEVWVLRPKVFPKEPKFWWSDLLKEHPKFADWFSPRFNRRRDDK